MMFINMLVNKLTKTTFNKCSFSRLFGKVCKKRPPSMQTADRSHDLQSVQYHRQDGALHMVNGQVKDVLAFPVNCISSGGPCSLFH